MNHRLLWDLIPELAVVLFRLDVVVRRTALPPTGRVPRGLSESRYSGAMGSWAEGPFDNDSAADFLDGLASSPKSGIDDALRTIEKAAPTEYLDVDHGAAAWAACELVAASFGYGGEAARDDRIVDVLDGLKPNEKQRVRALSILPRLADRKTSELAALWAENGAGPDHAVSQLDVAFADLRARLEQASAGARAAPKPKAGDVLLLVGANEGDATIVLQVIGAREVAVFEGAVANDDEALRRVNTAPARRVLASAGKLHQRARVLGNVPLRKELKGKKLYAHDTGSLGEYMLATAAVGAVQMVTYEEALTFDREEHHDEEALRAVAAGTKAVARVRSPDAHEAEIHRRHANEWAMSRATTTPGPFGDVAQVESFLAWIDECGLDNAIDRMHDLAVGAQGYGRPSEDSERRPYVFAGIVAVWRGGFPTKAWPAALEGRFPEAPNAKRLAFATNAARILASTIITRDSALRMIWDQAPDGGKALRRWVADLQAALE